MTVFASDLFNGTANQAIAAYRAAWLTIFGMTGGMSLSASGTRLRGNGGSAGFYLSDSPGPSPNYRVTGKFFITATTSGPQLGISGRVSADAATYYHARIVSGTGIQLVRFLNGTALTLATAPYTVAVNAEPVLALVMDGDQISVELNGAVVIPAVTDTAITEAGYIGVRALNNNSQLTLDEMSAETLDTGGGATTTTVSPAAAALMVTGYAPSVAQTANQAVSPAPAGLIVTGFAPMVTQTSGNAISPTPAALVVQGYAPLIEQTRTLEVSPAPAGLVVQGWAPTITQTGTQPLPEVTPVPSGGGGGGGSVREVRAFADELDRAHKPTKAEKKKRRQAIEAAVLELLPDEPAAERAAPVIAQAVARQLPTATWAPIRAMQPVALPPAVDDIVHARVAAWLEQQAHEAHQALLAELEDDFETELLLLG